MIQRSHFDEYCSDYQAGFGEEVAKGTIEFDWERCAIAHETNQGRFETQVQTGEYEDSFALFKDGCKIGMFLTIGRVTEEVRVRYLQGLALQR